MAHLINKANDDEHIGDGLSLDPPAHEAIGIGQGIVAAARHGDEAHKERPQDRQKREQDHNIDDYSHGRAASFLRPPKAYSSAGLAIAALFQQAPRNDLGLNFARSFEDVEDAGVAQETAYRIFEGKPITTMNLQGVIRRRPCHTGR